MNRPTSRPPVLAIASNNAGKVSELRELLGPGIQLVTMDDLGLASPEETGATFAENAEIKARFLHAHTGLPSLADDSGLEVDALGGAPGVHSARFAGDGAGDADNRRRLLDILRDVAPDQRQARFVSVIAVIASDGTIHTTRGECAGSISLVERGDNGFGYDALFLLPDGRTMAQLPPGEKNRISHRARAMERARAPILAALGLSEP